MTMSTIFAVVKDGKVVAVANSTSAGSAQLELAYWPGELYACQVSDSIAFEVREAVKFSESNTRKPSTDPLTMLKRYSQAMQKVADITT